MKTMLLAPFLAPVLLAPLAVMTGVSPLLLSPAPLEAQSPWLDAGFGAVVAGSWFEPIPGGGSAREVRVEQPIIHARAGAWLGSVEAHAHGMLNLEGITMPDGVLTLGTFGEGFVDRRHPHTYVHELMVSLQAGDVSLVAGKGFVAFGTDDPMNRPALRYPVNHHYAQVMERAVVTLAARRGPVVVEGSFFNGDEPESPGQWPSLDRFGDSWSARVLLQPKSGVELQASHARVASPEHRPGSGPDAVRWSASGRVEREALYALVEWGRTTEADGFFAYGTLLGEVEWRTGRHRPFYRLERTERPEEERSTDPFRSQRPHLDDSILGTTRWTIHTAGWRTALTLADRIRVEPLAEVSLGRVQRTGSGVFDPVAFYGKRSLWTFTVGARLAVGGAMHRMGRYGVLRSEGEQAIHGGGQAHEE